MSVVYLSYDGALDPLGGSQVLPYVEGLAERGFSMGLVSFEKPDRLADEGAREALEARLFARGVRWVPLRYHRRPSLLATAFDVLQGLWAVRRMSGWEGVRLLHARSYVAGLLARLLAGKDDVPWIFDMRGFWVDERVEAGLWSEGGLVTRLARAEEQRLLGDADALVLLTELGAERVGGLVSDPIRAPVRVIPTCVDLKRFRSAEDRERVRRELGLDGGPVVVYAGSLSTWYLPELTVRVGEAFRARTGGSFVILTHEVAFARELCARVGVRATIRSVAHDQMPRWLGVADAGLAFVRPSWAKGASAPTKIGEYLASGLAVAATGSVGDLDTHFRDTTVAFTVDADEADPTRIAERIAAAAGRPDRIVRARELARRRYDLEDGIDSYAALYRELGGAP